MPWVENTRVLALLKKPDTSKQQDGCKKGVWSRPYCYLLGHSMFIPLESSFFPHSYFCYSRSSVAWQMNMEAWHLYSHFRIELSTQRHRSEKEKQGAAPWLLSPSFKGKWQRIWKRAETASVITLTQRSTNEWKHKLYFSWPGLTAPEKSISLFFKNNHSSKFSPWVPDSVVWATRLWHSPQP